MTLLSPAYLAAMVVLWVATQFTASRVRQAFYLAASWAFYYSLAGTFSAILLFSTILNFFWGGLLRRRPHLTLLAVGVLANVALLSIFKYLPGLASPWAEGSSIAASIAALALPLGISFWTFQGLSYLFDQYRGDDLDPSMLEFCLYMSFAPTVLSGPICRVSELLPQFRSSTRADWNSVRTGAQSVWIGVWMIAVARVLASGLNGDGLNRAFEHKGGWSGPDAWAMLAGFGFQLFFDFAGYSRLVIGIAQMFGIRLPENFNRPFLASTPTAFWQRWHMSLSYWIRDYLFMPLAMQRRELWWRNGALIVAMVVFGLWHKASWLFFLWGLYQGLLLLSHRLWQQHARPIQDAIPERVSAALAWVWTFAAITISWILFRADTLEEAGALFQSTIVPHMDSVMPASFHLLVLSTGAGYFLWTMLSSRSHKEDEDDEEAVRKGLLSWMPVELRFALYAGIFYVAVFRSAEPQSFIYLQF